MTYYIDVVGFYGPIILGFINLFHLWSRRYYFMAFIAGYFTNVFINGVLKNLIREPRPSNQIYLNGHDVPTQADRFGMPSGHAQLTAYAITFLYLTVDNPMALITSMFIGSITLFQRYTYRRHTPKQLIAGLILGAVTANIVWNARNARNLRFPATLPCRDNDGGSSNNCVGNEQ